MFIPLLGMRIYTHVHTHVLYTVEFTKAYGEGVGGGEAMDTHWGGAVGSVFSKEKKVVLGDRQPESKIFDKTHFVTVYAKLCTQVI